MRDIERELRALGEAERERDGGAGLDTRSLRRIRMSRLLTSGVALLAVLGLVAGGTYAAGAFREPNDIQPAEEETTLGEQPDLLFSSIGGKRVTLMLFRPGGFACFSDDVFDETLTRVEIVDAASESSVVKLFPADSTIVVEGQSCVSNLEAEPLTRIAEAPDAYRLLVEEAGQVMAGELFGPNQGASADCGLPLRFAPTYLPSDWPRGFVPLSEDAEAVSVLGHFGPYREPQGADFSVGFAGLATHDMPFIPPESADLEILGSPASLEEDENSVRTAFGYEGCRYSLYGIGMERAEFVRFAEGLRPRDDASGDGEPTAFAAIWPEDDRASAVEGCGRDVSLRSDPASVALEFGSEVLGWEQAAGFGNASPGVPYEIRRDASDDGRKAKGAAVHVYLFEVSSDCWSVYSVSPVPEGSVRAHGSMSVRGRDVFMRFAKRGAASVTHQVGYSGEVTRHEWSSGQPENVTFTLNFEPEGTGHFLLLYRDPDGAVFSAQGSSLREGDFAAG